MSPIKVQVISISTIPYNSYQNDMDEEGNCGQESCGESETDCEEEERSRYAIWLSTDHE